MIQLWIMLTPWPNAANGCNSRRRDTVQSAKGGRGKKGGLSEAAAEIGIQRQEAQRLINAADVFIHVRENLQNGNPQDFLQVSDLQVLMGMDSHLSEISAAPSSAWLPLVQWLLTDKMAAPNLGGPVKTYRHGRGVLRVLTLPRG